VSLNLIGQLIKVQLFLRRYMGGDWEALQEEHMIRTLALAFRKCLELIPIPTPPPLAQLHDTWALLI